MDNGVTHPIAETAALVEHLSKILPLDAKEIAKVKELFVPKRIKRRQLIHHEGDVCKHASFVVQGCLKMYMVDVEAKEHNLQFAVEDNWIGDWDLWYSLFYQAPDEALQRARHK